MTPVLRRSTLTALLLTLAMAAAITLAPVADAQPTWAPANQATITPGVQTYTDGAQCTSNFVFFGGGDVYIGQAAHCSGTGGPTETNGCDSGSLPLGTPVEVDGASRPGTLAYNSWLTMQSVDETDPDACSYNDFALIKLDPADHASVNPSLPVIGGPVGINTIGTSTGEFVHSYGNSSLRFGLSPLSPKLGISLGTTGNGWTHPHYAVTPGIPGDSGSAFLDDSGNALGVLSTLVIAPTPASNNASDVNRALNYMLSNGGPQVDLALGTEPFTPLTGGGLPVRGLLPILGL
ncbi:MAG: serine protease [Euzebya sp.]